MLHGRPMFLAYKYSNNIWADEVPTLLYWELADAISWLCMCYTVQQSQLRCNFSRLCFLQGLFCINAVYYRKYRVFADTGMISWYHGVNDESLQAFSSSSSSFNFKAHEMSNSVQIKTGTTRQETALTVALKVYINMSIKQTVNKALKAYNIRKTETAKIR